MREKISRETKKVRVSVDQITYYLQRWRIKVMLSNLCQICGNLYSKPFKFIKSPRRSHNEDAIVRMCYSPWWTCKIKINICIKFYTRHKKENKQIQLTECQVNTKQNEYLKMNSKRVNLDFVNLMHVQFTTTLFLFRSLEQARVVT